jgi:hypothetical protein
MIEMSHWISVFFFPVEKSELPKELESWQSIEPILSSRWEKRAEFGIRSTTSRNWWHQDALDQICKGLGIVGLEFILSEVACLCEQELEIASVALERIARQIAHGLPPLGEHEVESGAVWWMRQYQSDGSFKEAFEKARPTYDASVSKDVGFEATVAFCSFVKSLQQTAIEAIEQDKCLLYIQPQP